MTKNYKVVYDTTKGGERYIEVSYEPGGKRWTFKTTDDSIDIGDFVVVYTTTRYNMTVCKVIAVNVKPPSMFIKDIIDKVRIKG